MTAGAGFTPEQIAAAPPAHKASSAPAPQPSFAVAVSLAASKPEPVAEVVPTTARRCPPRYRLPDERRSLTRRFHVGAMVGYFTVGLYDDGAPGELFITIEGAGSTLRGLCDAVAVGTSMLLQHGVPLANIAEKYSNTRFPPEGATDDPVRPLATSVLDYVFRWLLHRYAAERCMCREHATARQAAEATG